MLGAPLASADSFYRVIERPIARYLLTETAEGREILFRVLGRAGAANHDAGALRRFAAAMEDESRWAGLGGEVQERIARAGDSLRALRSEEGALRRSSDAVAHLRRFARAELRLARPASPGEVSRIRFVTPAEKSYSGLRTAFLDDVEVGAGEYAKFILSERIEILSEGVAELEFTRVPDSSHVWALVGELRGLGLETAIQLEGARSAYSGHRSYLLSLAQRLARQVDRISSGSGAVRSITVARMRRELLDELAEVRGWLVTRTGN